MAGIESSGSNHFEITKEITEFCPSGLTRSSSMAHARNGCSQSSRFLPQARRIIGSGDENDIGSDHHLLMAKVRLKIAKVRKGESGRVLSEESKLKDLKARKASAAQQI